MPHFMLKKAPYGSLNQLVECMRNGFSAIMTLFGPPSETGLLSEAMTKTRLFVHQICNWRIKFDIELLNYVYLVHILKFFRRVKEIAMDLGIFLWLNPSSFWGQVPNLPRKWNSLGWLFIIGVYISAVPSSEVFGVGSTISLLETAGSFWLVAAEVRFHRCLTENWSVHCTVYQMAWRTNHQRTWCSLGCS